MTSQTVEVTGPPASLPPAEQVTILTHSIDVVWQAWQYQLDRTREFLVLLSSLAAGVLLLAFEPDVSRAYPLMGAALGVLLCAYWANLNSRWAKIIQEQTTTLFAMAERYSLVGEHAYLSKKAAQRAKERPPLWWTRGTMGFPLIFGAFYLLLLAVVLLKP